MKTKIKNKFLAMVMLIITVICMPLVTKSATGDEKNQVPLVGFKQAGGEVVKKSTEFVTQSNPEGYGTVLVIAKDPEGEGIAYIKYSWDLGTDKEISDNFNYTKTKLEASRIEKIKVPQENGLHILRVCAVDKSNKQSEWSVMPYYIVNQKSTTVDSTAPDLPQPDGINFPKNNAIIEVNRKITLSATDDESGIYYIAYNWTRTGESEPTSSNAYTKVVGPINGKATITAPKTPGNWTLRYYAANSTYNTTRKAFMTSGSYYADYIVKDTTKPVATLIGENTLNLTEGDIYTDEGATITDNSDETRIAYATNLEELQNKGIIEVDGNSYKFVKRGTYTLNYVATDSSNNTSEIVTRTVNVIGEREIIELTAPTEIVTYNYGEEIRLEDFSIKVTSKTGEVSYPSVTKDMFKEFNTNGLGKYTATFTYKLNGQTKSTTFMYMVNDYIDAIEVIEPTKTVYEYKESLNLAGGKVKVIMKSGDYSIIPMDESMLVDENDFDSNTLGEQIIHIKYDEKIKTFKVEIKDTTPPEITFIHGTELKVLIDNNINLNDYEIVEEYDKDKHLEIKVEIDRSKLNISKVGTYEITYKVTDTNQNSTTKTRTVKVYIDENNEDLKKLNDLKKQIKDKDLVETDYTPESWKDLDDALKMDEDTKQGIKDKIDALEEAIIGLETDFDTTRFEELRKQVIELMKHSTDYTSESWGKLENKYSAAVEAKETGLQSKLDPALDELESAIDSLVVEDFTEHKEQVIEDLEKYIKTNFDENDYTPESLQKLQDAINDAKNKELQSEFDKAIENIRKELEKELNNKPNEILVPNEINPEKLNSIKNKLDSLNKEEYTEESIQAIKDQFEDAEEQRLQSDFNEIVNNIDLSTLVLKVVISDVQIDTTNSNKAFAKVDDVITVTFNTNVALDLNATEVKLNNSRINLEKVSEENITISKDEPTKPTQNSYKATFKMDNGCIEGEISYSIFAVEARHVEENEQKQTAKVSGKTGITFDKTAPTITFAQGIGDKTIEVKTKYEVKKSDVVVSDILTTTDKLDVTIESSLNVNVVGNYEVKYIVKDLAGNEASITRTITVGDSKAPIITLNGDNPVTIEVGQKYEEKGAIVTDNYDTDIKLDIDSTALDIYVAGRYEIIYTATDKKENSATVKRVVFVLYKGYLKDAIKRTEGLLESDYDVDAWQKLQKALEKPETTQAEIDAKTKAINDAVDNLSNNKKPLDMKKYNELKKIIDELNTHIEDYTDESWNNLVQKSTEADNAKIEGLQSKFTVAVDNLETAINSLVAEEIQNKEDIINGLKDVLNSYAPKSDYTEESWQAVEKAIEDASKIELKSEFNEAVDKIREDITGTPSILVPKKLDTKALDDKIAQVNQLNKKDYTEKSWTALGSLIAKAKQQKLQSKLDEAVSKIDLSILVLKPVITDVSITSNNTKNSSFAKSGDTITLSFGSNVELDLTKTTAKLNNSLINITKVGDKYQGIFTMNDGCVEGEITYSIHAVETRVSAAIDKTGNTGIIFDKTAPVINLKENVKDVIIKYGERYAPSIEDVEVIEKNERTVQILPEDFSSKVLGDHTITYQVVDAAGNIGNTVTRNIKVIDYITGIKVNTLPNKDTYKKDEALDKTGGTIQLVLASGAPGQIIDMNDSNVNIEGFNTTIPGTITLTVKYNYEGKEFKNTFELIILDSDKPTIKLIGNKKIYLEVGSTYTELGATVEDNVDKDLKVSITGTVDTSKVGDYKIYYNVTDKTGNAATQKIRTIHVEDTTKPVITQLNGNNPLQLEAGEEYKELGATAIDNYDGDISNKVKVEGRDLNNLKDHITVPGTYTLRYFVKDASDNTSDYVIRTVIIKDTTKPVITLEGDEEVTIEVNETYTDEGATVTDIVDKDLEATIAGEVVTTRVGEYTLTYSAVDTAGNIADSVTRTVKVVDTTKPVIALKYPVLQEISIKVGEEYTDFGATATDNYDGDITNEIVVNNPVNTSVIGDYTITYDVTDSNGNNAVQLTRIVHVIDDIEPVVTLIGDSNTYTVIAGERYIDNGAKVTDNYDAERIIYANNITELINQGAVREVEENTYIFINEGVYTLNYKTKDTSKNPSNEETVTITVQAIPPKVSFVVDGVENKLENGAIFNKDIEIKFDKGTASLTNNTTGQTINDFKGGKLADGDYTIIARDDSGSETRVSFTVDSVPPVVNLRTGTYYGSATIEFANPSDIASAILISGNNKPEPINANGKTVISEEGIYSLFAVDVHGNYTRVDFEVVK